MKKISLFILAIFIVVGCSDSNESKKSKEVVPQKAKIDKTASAENFKRVLNDYFSRHCIGIDLDKELPAYVRKYSNGSIDQQYLDLEKLGLVKLSDAHFDRNADKIGKTDMYGEPYKVEMVDGKKIELTQKGKKIYKVIPKDERGFSKKAEFCLANYEVVEITNYTKPQNVGPVTLSRVHYRAKPTNVVPFINDMNKTKYLKHYKDIATQEVSKSADLVLTEMKGWMHASEFKKGR